MTTPPFPVVGVVAPLAVSLVMWWVTGSAFALMGAVIAPTMVLAHFLDSRRRARREQREKETARTRDEAVHREAQLLKERTETLALRRQNPAIADIAQLSDWAPPRDGNALVRAGHAPGGRPWLVDVSGGVAVVGSGSAAESVWTSLTVLASAHLGPPTVNEPECRWGNGALIIRGPSPAAEITIRCEGDEVVSVGRRGAVPESVDWIPDDVSRADCVSSRLAMPVSTRLSISLNSVTPHVLFAGRTGSGKSHALATTVADWATRHPPSEFTFIGIDFKGGATLRQLEQFPHHLATVTDLESHHVPRAMWGIATEMRRREIQLRRHGVPSIDDLPGLARLAIVIDEVHEFLRQFPAAHELLGDIARRGRSLGVHLVLAVQHPSGVLRDSVLGNIPVRVCLAMNTPHDVMSVVGKATTMAPSRGHALVTFGDGHIRELEIPTLVAIPDDSTSPAPKLDPPWKPVLVHPVAQGRHPGFGLIDDVENAEHIPALWLPTDGDVAIIGDAGSGRTTAARMILGQHDSMWISSGRQIPESGGVVVIDNIDRILGSLSHREADELLASITRARQRSTRFVVTSAAPMPRSLGGFRDTLTLRRATLDDHRATGAPPETFDPAAAPGVGTWRGRRVVIYASTESIDTASIP